MIWYLFRIIQRPLFKFHSNEFKENIGLSVADVLSFFPELFQQINLYIFNHDTFHIINLFLITIN